MWNSSHMGEEEGTLGRSWLQPFSSWIIEQARPTVEQSHTHTHTDKHNNRNMHSFMIKFAIIFGCILPGCEFLSGLVLETSFFFF